MQSKTTLTARPRLLAVAAAFVVALLAVRAIPKPPLKRGIALSHAVYDRAGHLLRLNIARDQKVRLWIPLEKQSPFLIDATLLKEDRQFYRHPGVNPVALARATWSTFVTRKRRLGGSTLTMQLARIRYRLATDSIPGKVSQILRALQLELFYSKREILETYLNLAPYGGNLEGSGAASLLYFSKHPKDLTLAEALALAVLPQKPGRIGGSGWHVAYQDLANKWRAHHSRAHLSASDLAFPIVRDRSITLPFHAPHFSEALIDDHPEESVLLSTLDSGLQASFEREISRYILRHKDVGVQNAAAILIDHRTREVRAYVGSADYFDSAISGQVNGVRAKRSPGSTLKPFVYALAMQEGLIHPLTMLKDAPASFGSFNPENFDGEFAGPLAAEDALRRSRNLPAVYLGSRLANPDLYDFLKKTNVVLPFDRRHYGMALILGGAEVSMEELGALYATLANLGRYAPLRFLRTDPKDEEEQVLRPEAAYLVLDILKDTPRPDERFQDAWTSSYVPVSWKTGTSFGFRDAWTAGVIGPYVLVVWVGNFNGEGNPAFVGGQVAAPLFFELIDNLKPRRDVRNYLGPTRPPLNEVEVCSVSGQLPNPSCPHRKKVLFIPGVSPIETCSIHREVRVDPVSGLRLCAESPRAYRTEVFEFWPTDLLRIYRQAGIPRRVPPPYHPDCVASAGDLPGLAPQVTSPRHGLVYSYRVESKQVTKIPLTTVADADVKEIFWFINQAYLGKAKTSKTLFWSPQPGRYIVRAVDDQGRSDSVSVSVDAAD